MEWNTGSRSMIKDLDSAASEDQAPAPRCLSTSVLSQLARRQFARKQFTQQQLAQNQNPAAPSSKITSLGTLLNTAVGCTWYSKYRLIEAVFLVPESEIKELGKEAWLDRRRRYRQLRESCRELLEQRNRDRAAPQYAERSPAERYYESDLKRNTPERPKDNYVRGSHRSNGNKTATASTRRQFEAHDRVANAFW